MSECYGCGGPVGLGDTLTITHCNPGPTVTFCESCTRRLNVALFDGQSANRTTS